MSRRKSVGLFIDDTVSTLHTRTAAKNIKRWHPEEECSIVKSAV